MSSALRTIDTDLALERAGGNRELARELYQMLQNDLPNYLAKIQHYTASGDRAALIEVVHKLKGSTTYCGVPALNEAAATLEERLRQLGVPGDEANITPLLGEIERLQQNPELDL